MDTRTLISVTEVRRNTARLIEQVTSSPGPLFVTQYGYITAVLLSPREYDALRAAERRNHDRRIMVLQHGSWERETAHLRDEEHDE